MSADDEIDLKEVYDSVAKHTKKFFSWKYVWEFLLLPVIYLTWWIRTRNLGHLQKQFLIGLDPYYYYRQASDVLSTGSLLAFDPMRVFPYGHTPKFNFFPYFLAYWNKFLNLFGGDVTLLYSGIIYNPVFTALSVVFFFLFLKNVFSKKIALLGSIILIVAPAYLFRTIAGFADHEALFMFLMFLALWLFSEIRVRKKLITKLSFAVAAGVVTFSAATTWSAIPILTIPIGAFILMHIFWGDKSKRKLFAYLVWLLSYIVPLALVRGIHSLGDISVLVPIFAIVNLGAYNLLEGKIKMKVPTGIIAIISTSILGLLGLIIFKIVDFRFLLAVILQPAEASGRVADTISEIIGGTAVFANFGWLLIMTVLGAGIAAYYGFDDENRKTRLILSLSVFLVGILILFGGKSTLFNLITLAAFPLILIAVYIKQGDFSQPEKDLVVIPIVMFLFTTYLTTTASRFLFVFAPTVAIFSAYCAVFIAENEPKRYKQFILPVILVGAGFIILNLVNSSFVKFTVLLTIGSLLLSYYLKPPIKLSYKKVVGLAIILLMAFTIQTSYEITVGQARNIGSSLPGQWNSAFVWLRDNTPEGSGVAHWWDYGYWTQSVANRPSIADGGTHGEYPLYLLGRYGMTGQTREDSLTYFNTQNISYLLFSREEIGKYWAFSHIGSNKDLDRETTIGTFGLGEVKEVRDGSRMIFRGNWRLDRDIVIDGKVYSKGSASITEFSFIGEGDEGMLVLRDASETVEFPLKCLAINGEKKVFDVETPLGGCFVLIPAFDQQGREVPMSAALYLSEKSANGLFGRLYLIGEKIEGFTEVYSDNTPLGIYKGQIIGPIKIWGITYSPDIGTNPQWVTITYDYEPGFR